MPKIAIIKLKIQLQSIFGLDLKFFSIGMETNPENSLNHVPKIENNNDNEDDDDYEVSNRLVDEYLVQTNSNYEEFLAQNSFTSTCPVDEFSSQPKDANNNIQTDRNSLRDQDVKPVSSSSTSHSNSSLLIDFIDRSTLKRTLDANAALFAQLVNHNDRTHICESYLSLTNRVHTSSTWSTLSKYSKLISLVSLFLLTSIYIGLWIEFIVLLFATLGFFKIVFLLVERLIIRDWLALASRYSECIRDVLTFLRESELVSLSVERRHLIETKSSSIVDFDDRLNLEFRRAVFFKLRDEFHRLRRLNLELNRFASLDDLLSSVSDSELADVLRIDSQHMLQVNELEIKTDYFSLACLKSLARVVRLVLSENFKLVVAVYVEMAFSDQNSCSFLVKSLVNGFVPVYAGFKTSIAQLNEIRDIIDLKNLINGKIKTFYW